MVFFIMMAFIFTALIFFQRTVELPYLKEIAPIACYLLPCLRSCICGSVLWEKGAQAPT